MDELKDRKVDRTVLDSRVLHGGVIWDLMRETVELGEAGTVTREFVRHPGAVAVIALNDDDDVLLVRQYRHPVGAELWEPPAGLLDVPEEDPLAAAQRELAEEADQVASSWWVLVDYLSSPGSSDEALRVYLARDMTPVPHHERHFREAEEMGMVARWFPLDDAVAAVLEGRLRNPSAVVGILAAAVNRDRGWTGLRPT
jgi:8-oxo-dGTP pyrophosphatase MutT (NUDIX family)